MPEEKLKQNEESKNNAEKTLTTKQQFIVDGVTGLGTGSIIACFFHPWDKALNAAQKNKHLPFLHLENFNRPFQGVFQTMFQRSFTWGAYYVLQGQLNTHLHPYLVENYKVSERKAQFIIGVIAGSINGALANPVSAVKYHRWADAKRNLTFAMSAKEMWSNGGYKPFINGATVTTLRDLKFGSCYELMRYQLAVTLSDDKTPNKAVKMTSSVVAGGVATIFSSPLNYVRTEKYRAAPDKKPPTIGGVLQHLWNDSKSYKKFDRLKFFQQRLRIGWGTARVAIGVGVGQEVFDRSRNALSETLKKKVSK